MTTEGAPNLEFSNAIDNAKRLAESLQGIKPEKFSGLKKEFIDNLSKGEIDTLKELVSVLENEKILNQDLPRSLEEMRKKTSRYNASL